MDHLAVIDAAYPSPGAMDTAISHAVLEAVAGGDMGQTLRLHVPGRVVAFGRSDRHAHGYRRAVQIAGAHGFAPVERLAGGHAAVFHENTLAFAWTVPDPAPRVRITERFRTIAETMVEAFRSLALDARVGEVPGEYCPGTWSVNLGGRVKVMGVGQRLVRGAAHVGGVVVVDDGYSIRDVLVPVYRALELDWDPRTAGSLAERSPGLDIARVTAAIRQAFSRRFHLTPAAIPGTVVSRADELLAAHRPETSR